MTERRKLWKAIMDRYPEWVACPDTDGVYRCPHGFKSCARCERAGIDYRDPTPAIEFLKSILGDTHDHP